MSLNNSGWKTTFLLTGPCVGDTLIFWGVLLYIEYIGDNDVCDYLIFLIRVYSFVIFEVKRRRYFSYSLLSASPTLATLGSERCIIYIYIYICFFISIILREMCIGKYM